LRWSALSCAGPVRPNNEDAFLALTFDAQVIHYLGKYGEGTLGTGDYIFAVSDGMGGANAGEFASRIAVEKITKLLPKGFRSEAAGLGAGFEDLLPEVFHETHRALTYLGANYPECAGMGSTLSLCWFAPGWAYFAHIGDTRIYYLPAAGGLKQITQDDTHVGWQLRNQRINEREARGHPLKNSLQKALGAGHQFVEPQVGAVGYQKGDLFLLCSDGLIDGLWDRQLLQLLREPDSREAQLPPAQRLVEAALERSGRDNTTALVVEVA
jgi:protein phosphatase